MLLFLVPSVGTLLSILATVFILAVDKSVVPLIFYEAVQQVVLS